MDRNNIKPLEGKVALVTGAGRGLGESMAIALARAGADMVLAGRRLDSLAQVCSEVEAEGKKAFAVEIDVLSEDSIERGMREAYEHYEHLDILINNAGCNVRKPALELTMEDWDRVLNTNLRGQFFCSKHAAPYMIKRNWGRIINIGSASCVFAYPDITAYCASRGGVLQMTKSLAAEWGKHGINVNVLAPGWFETEQTRVLYEDKDWVEYITERIPLGRTGHKADLDGSVVFLASDASEYITGQLLLIDGGFTTGTARASSSARK